MKSGHFPGVEFICVDYTSYSAIRETFRKLYNACLPKDSRSRFGKVFKESHRGNATGEAGSDLENNVAASGEKVIGRDGGGNASRGTPEDVIIAIAESGWLEQIQSLLQLAGVVVDIMSIQGASVAVCLENGVDIATQVSGSSANITL